MGVTIVRALDSIKPNGIGGMANYPVEFWILRYHIVDSILGKRLTFLAEALLIRVLYKELLPLTGSSDSTQTILRVTAATIAMTTKT